MTRRLFGSLFGLIVLLVTAEAVLGQSPSSRGKKSASEYRFEVVRQLPHDSAAPDLFGEGVTVLGNEVIQLTWQSHVGFVYNLSNFHLVRTFQYSGEGWGLTTDGRDLFMSDGSAEIRVLDARTFAEKRRIKVSDRGKPVDQLNELEFVEGEIYANVWHSDRIARILPQTGGVVGWIDLTGLLGSFYQREPEAVLNGIAYDDDRKRLFVTGKWWPKIFEIRVIPKHSQ